ncbi:MAG: hypothetical protein WCJ61_05750 [Paludibacter sp.]
MKKIIIVLLLVLNLSCLFSQSVQICGNFRLIGYSNNGESYDSKLTLTKTDNGIVAKGAINEYLSELPSSMNDSDVVVSYMNNNGVYRITFYKNGSVVVKVEGLNDLKCLRVK